MATRKLHKPRIIGSTDHIDLPGFGIYDLPCKIDTGAQTSSIHCERFKIVEKDGVEYLTFKLLDKRFKSVERKTFRFSEFKEKKIRSSFGDTEFRYAVKSTVILFGKEYNITFTLSNRGSMQYPVLIGKRFLKNKFLVDVAQHDLSYRQKLTNTTP